MRSTAAAALFLAGCLALPATASAQALGTVAGVVKDAGVTIDGAAVGAGRVLPGVTVVFSQASNETVRTTTTDGNGQYRVAGLAVGVYTVRFTLAGFTTVEMERVEVKADFTATLDANLRVAQLAGTFTVPPGFAFSPGFALAVPRPGAKVVCGMTLIPGDASIDPKILRPLFQTGIKPSAGVIAPPICGAK